MIKATVIGPVWATKRVDALPPGALLELVENESGRRLIALDQLGSGTGETVLVTLGAGVAASFPGRAPIDALVVGVLDELTPPSRIDVETVALSHPSERETTNRKETKK